MEMPSYEPDIGSLDCNNADCNKCCKSVCKASILNTSGFFGFSLQGKSFGHAPMVMLRRLRSLLHSEYRNKSSIRAKFPCSRNPFYTSSMHTQIFTYTAIQAQLTPAYSCISIEECSNVYALLNCTTSKHLGLLLQRNLPLERQL